MRNSFNPHKKNQDDNILIAVVSALWCVTEDSVVSSFCLKFSFIIVSLLTLTVQALGSMGIHGADPTLTWYELGLRSLQMGPFAAHLSHLLNKPVSITDFWAFPTPAALIQMLVSPRKDLPAAAAASMGPRSNAEPIAVLGMACRFPQVDSVDELWDRLVSGAQTAPNSNVAPVWRTTRGVVVQDGKGMAGQRGKRWFLNVTFLGGASLQPSYFQLRYLCVSNAPKLLFFLVSFNNTSYQFQPEQLH